MDSSWHYLRLGRAKSLPHVVFDHLVTRGLVGALAGSTVLHGICYLAVSRHDAPTSAWICPLDLSGQYGQHQTGYQAIHEDDIPLEASDYWCCASSDFLAQLDPARSPNACHWRTRCAGYEVGNARLGPLQAKRVLMLTSPVSPDSGIRCRIAEVVDARKGLMRLLDHPTQLEIRMSRHLLIKHGAEPAQPVDVERMVADARATFIGGNHEVHSEGGGLR